MHTLQNNFITATFQSKGAELISLQANSTEYLWQANPKIWGRHAPILFPFVGRLKDDEYFFKNKTYAMKQHGFARNNDFKIVKKTADSILFELNSNTFLKENYPFDFVLQLKYSLSKKSLKTEYSVKNPSKNEALLFSIGAHPAFNCPFETGQKRNEYKLVFDKKVAPKSENLNDGFYLNTQKQYFKENGVLQVTDTLFNEGALTFKSNPFSKVTFVHKPTQKEYLSIAFQNYPYLGIWSQNNTSTFVCIEPWHGIADTINTNKELKEKEGIITLEPNDNFSCNFTIEIL